MADFILNSQMRLKLRLSSCKKFKKNTKYKNSGKNVLQVAQILCRQINLKDKTDKDIYLRNITLKMRHHCFTCCCIITMLSKYICLKS